MARVSGGISAGLRSIPPLSRGVSRQPSPARVGRVVPGGQGQLAREALRAALAEKVKQIERLIVEAVNEEEAEFWRRELTRCGTYQGAVD